MASKRNLSDGTGAYYVDAVPPKFSMEIKLIWREIEPFYFDLIHEYAC
jgi:hypothetical protein